MARVIEICVDSAPPDLDDPFAADAARRLLILILLLAVKDRSTQVRYQPGDHPELSYVVDGRIYPLVPPPESLRDQMGRALRDHSRRAGLADRLGAALRRWASRLDGGDDTPLRMPLRLRIGQRSLDCQAYFWPTPLGEAFAINFPQPIQTRRSPERPG